MTKNLSFFTKLFTVVFVLSVCFSATNAQAQLATIDAGNLVQNTSTAVSTGVVAGSAPATAAATNVSAAANTTNTATNIAQFSWISTGKNLLDTIAYEAAQKLLTQLTQNTVAWIQGGFHGSPSFAVDTKAIETQIADNIAGGLVLSLRNIAVCNFTANYKDDLVNTIDLSTKKQPYLYNQKAACPFKETYNFKASDFYGTTNQALTGLAGSAGKNLFDWGKFGMALNDGGNPYGLQMITAQEQASREAAAKAQKDKELSWSKGFTSIKDTTDCNYPPEVVAAMNGGSTLTVGSTADIGVAGNSLYTAQQAYNKAQSDLANFQDTNHPELSDAQYNATLASYQMAVNTAQTAVSDAQNTFDKVSAAGSTQGAGDTGSSITNPNYLPPEAVKAYQDAYCKTTTPGNIVSDQLTKSLGINFDRLGFADNMNKIVAAFLDVMTQKAIRGVFGTGNSSVGTHNTGSLAGGPGAIGSAPLIAVTTYPADPFTQNTATLHGWLSSAPLASNVQVWFIFGETSGSGIPLPTTISVTTFGQSFKATVTDLKPDTTYFFNTIATTGNRAPDQSPSTLHGAERSFHTPK